MKKKKKSWRTPFPAPPTFCVPFTFASSLLSLSEGLKQTIARWEVCLGKNPTKATCRCFEKTIIMLSSILTPCSLFCVNNGRSSPWNSYQLFLFYYYFFSVLHTPLNSGIVGFYRIDVGRYMVDKSPYIAKSISRIPLPPGMCQVVCGSPGRLGVGN